MWFERSQARVWKNENHNIEMGDLLLVYIEVSPFKIIHIFSEIIKVWTIILVLYDTTNIVMNYVHLVEQLVSKSMAWLTCVTFIFDNVS